MRDGSLNGSVPLPSVCTRYHAGTSNRTTPTEDPAGSHWSNQGFEVSKLLLFSSANWSGANDQKADSCAASQPRCHLLRSEVPYPYNPHPKFSYRALKYTRLHVQSMHPSCKESHSGHIQIHSSISPAESHTGDLSPVSTLMVHTLTLQTLRGRYLRNLLPLSDIPVQNFISRTCSRALRCRCAVPENERSRCDCRPRNSENSDLASYSVLPPSSQCL